MPPTDAKGGTDAREEAEDLEVQDLDAMFCQDDEDAGDPMAGVREANVCLPKFAIEKFRVYANQPMLANTTTIAWLLGRVEELQSSKKDVVSFVDPQVVVRAVYIPEQLPQADGVNLGPNHDKAKLVEFCKNHSFHVLGCFAGLVLGLYVHILRIAIYIHMFICMYIRRYMRMSVDMHAHACACTYMHMYVCPCVLVLTYIRTRS